MPHWHGLQLDGDEIATAPTTKAEIRATQNFLARLALRPLWITLVQKSCANEVDALMVKPATTARIVANAIAEMNAKKTFPARACASSGALMLVPP